MSDDSKHDPRQVTVHQHLGIPEPARVNPSHLSTKNDHRTPHDIVERARVVLGGIDLDPFSSAEANETIRATDFFDGTNADGFEMNWQGRVFCNPPGGKTKNRSNQKRAWFKLAEEYATGLEDDSMGATSAIFVCFSVELLQTTQSKTPDGLPLPLDFPICYPKRRLAYLGADGKPGKSPPHSSCLIFVPPRTPRGCWKPESVDLFARTFADVGRVVIPAGHA